jgi:bacteriocin-like protein
MLSSYLEILTDKELRRISGGNHSHEEWQQAEKV